MIQLAPSILTADFSRLGEQVGQALAAGAERIHFDVMDGRFVPNITFGPRLVECLNAQIKERRAMIEVHLMIEEPDRYLADFAKAGADMLIVHVETCRHLHRTLQAIRELGVQPAVTLNPATPLGAIEDVLAEVEQVLVMTVNPGFGGQEFIPGMLDKIARLRTILGERDLDYVAIEVDGGVHTETIRSVVKAGATVAVAGSAVFNDKGSVADNLHALRAAAG